ncbi:MAG: hypothetical protein OCD76_12375 [Reichenbachiella sp.]
MRLIVAILFLPSVIFGQNNFEEGFIVHHSGDTITGLVNAKSLKSLGRQCEFKQGVDAKVNTYSPGEIWSYGILPNKFYQAKEVSIEGQEEVRFLEYLVNGVVDLYFLRNNDADKYFLEKEGVLYELSNNAKEVRITDEDDQTKTFLKYDNQYKGGLNYLFYDTPEMKNAINSSEFDAKSLIKVTKKYHNYTCDDYACIDYSKGVETSFSLRPTLGFAFSNFKRNGYEDVLYDNSLLIGLVTEINPALMSDNWLVLWS